MPSERQHFIPAAFLGRFSPETERQRLRERRLYVAQRGNTSPFNARADEVAYIRGLYGPLDQLWTKYERRLPQALDELCAPESSFVSGETWLRVLVPFVTCLLLRGPDFEKRFIQRFGEMWSKLKDLVGRNTPRDARALEIQRLLALVTAGRWKVLHSADEELVVTSDIAWAPYRDPETQSIGLAIPLDRKTVLGLVPWRTRRVLIWDSANWRAPMEHHVLIHGNLEGLNAAMAASAQRQVYAPTLELSEAMLSNLSPEPPTPLEPFPLRRPGPDEIANEFTWHRLVSVLNKKPSSLDIGSFEIDWEYLAQEWVPTIAFGLNVPEFPAALRLENEAIEVGLFQVREVKADGWIIEGPWDSPPN